VMVMWISSLNDVPRSLKRFFFLDCCLFMIHCWGFFDRFILTIPEISQQDLCWRTV
jgi:hypothetical protein